jgi:hypothetical protein
MNRPFLTIEERYILHDYFLNKPVDKPKILARARQKTVEVRDWYRSLPAVDVYIAGRLTKETLEDFDRRAKRLEKLGYTFYEPAELILSRFEKGELDLEMLGKARTVFVSTPVIGMGTFTEIGKIYGEKPVIVHYTGTDLYNENIPTCRYMRDYSPLTFYHVSDDMDVAFGCLLGELNGTVKFEEVTSEDKISGEKHTQKKCLNCSSFIFKRQI